MAEFSFKGLFCRLSRDSLARTLCKLSFECISSKLRLDSEKLDTFLSICIESPQMGAVGFSLVPLSMNEFIVPPGCVLPKESSGAINWCCDSDHPPPRSGVNFSTVFMGTSIAVHFSTEEWRKYEIRTCKTDMWLTTMTGATCCSISMINDSNRLITSL